MTDFTAIITIECNCGLEILITESTTLVVCTKCLRKYQVQADIHVYQI